MVPAHNPLTVPVVIDDEGRQLAGGAWGPVDESLVVRDAEASQRLILFPDGLPDDADPAILAQVYPAPVDDGDPSTPDPAATDASAAASDDDELGGDLEAPTPPPAPKRASGSRKASR